jgi:hypothetical protein
MSKVVQRWSQCRALWRVALLGDKPPDLGNKFSFWTMSLTVLMGTQKSPGLTPHIRHGCSGRTYGQGLPFDCCSSHSLTEFTTATGATCACSGRLLLRKDSGGAASSGGSVRRPSFGSGGSAQPPPTPPALGGGLGTGPGSESSGSVASSFPASCSPQLPFAFTPSALSLSSLHDHSVR